MKETDGRKRRRSAKQIAAERAEEVNRACEYAAQHPWVYLGMTDYYRMLVRENRADEALIGAVRASGADPTHMAFFAALASTSEDARQYHATMTPRREAALARVRAAAVESSAAATELREAEAEDGCWERLRAHGGT